jgi:hypothetical protein
MSDGTNSKSWQKFLAELAKEDVDFSTIQHADESTRAQLLQSITTLSSIDRAQVSSTWTKLASSGKISESDSTPSRDPPVPIREAASSRVPEIQAPLRSSPSFGRQQQAIAQQSFGRLEESGYIPPAAPEYGNNTPLGSTNRSGISVNNRSMSQQPAAPPPPPVLAVPMMNLGISGSDLAALLRTALDRGDCGTALPLASEMLQTDPNGLVYLLNEFLPQLSVDQLKTILGVGVPMGADSPKEVSGSPQRSTSKMQQPLQSMYSPSSYDDSSPGIEMTTQPTLNGQPLSAGQVLTAHSIQSQYGPRFTATCNGVTLKFPYCVQRGDKIVVRSAANADRLL